jgi:hypothetical protein
MRVLAKGSASQEKAAILPLVVSFDASLGMTRRPLARSDDRNGRGNARFYKSPRRRNECAFVRWVFRQTFVWNPALSARRG